MSLLTQASLILTPNAVKASKLYSIIPSNGNGDMDVVRATTATRVNSLGLIESVAENVPRLNYDGSCPSILVEGQRTNLLTYSEMFSDVSWVKGQSTITINTINAPNGTLTADTITANGVALIHNVGQNFPFLINTSYTFSVYLKANTNNFAQLTFPGGGFSAQSFVNFDLINGVLGTIGSASTATITSVGNGWYRCSITATCNNSITQAPTIVIITSSTSIRNEANSLTTSLYIWGAQLEADSYATSYIPTTNQAITRNADAISKTGIADLIGQTEGTFFIDFQNKVNEITTGLVVRMLYTITDGTNNNRFSQSIVRTPTRNYTDISIRSNNITVSSFNVDTPTGRFKIAVSYKIGATKMFINGVLVGNVGLSEIPIINRLFLGCSTTSGGDNANVGINTFLTVKTALTDAECIALTTL